jgi:FKBP-type peptidyl-prolyl cis-trans isomerase
MTKQKIGVVLGCLVAAVLLLGGGYYLGKQHFGKVTNAQASLSDGQASQNVSSLDQSNASDSSGGLSVSQGAGATSLGQLGNHSGQTATGSSGTSASTNSSSGSSGIDPSTFAQYDKYKDQSHALFGEIQKGSGDELTADKKAAVVYKGWLTNGQMFDQSRPGSDGKLQPFVFQMGAHQVIPGWEEGLVGMKVGGSRLVIVPPAVGYGSTAQGSIPANSLLVFQVQLVAVQ